MTLRTIPLLLLALALGLLGGYLMFGRSAAHDHGGTAAAPADGVVDEVWTCSMHPQIRAAEPGDCPLCGMDLIPATTEAESDPTVLTMTEAAVALARIRTMTVGRGNAISVGDDSGSTEAGAGEIPESATLSLTGKLAPDERTAAIEVTEYAGRVERLFVSYPGERVRAGQRIATVYSPDLVIAQEEFLQARRFADLEPELVAAAREKLSNLQLTTEQIAELEESGTVRNNFPVYADRSGTVLAMQAEVGQYLPAGGSLYTYTNLSQLWVLLDAQEGQLRYVRTGAPLTFTVPALGAETYTGRVTFVDPFIDPATRTATVRAEVNNRSGRLKPGMFVEGRLPLVEERGREELSGDGGNLTVPATAVLWTGERSVVYLEVPDREVPTYAFREVLLGERIGDAYRIVEGLTAGDRVVINGAFSIDAAAQLNNQASMMNRDVVIASDRSGGEVIIPDYRAAATPALLSAFDEITGTYFLIRDNMVASEMAGEDLVAPLRVALETSTATGLEGAPLNYWEEHRRNSLAHLKLLGQANDLEAQREQFGYLSTQLIELITAFGSDKTIYVQYCPMAFDDTGANWLSEADKVLNPYFGDRMLRCGIVEDVIEGAE